LLDIAHTVGDAHSNVFNSVFILVLINLFTTVRCLWLQLGVWVQCCNGQGVWPVTKRPKVLPRLLHCHPVTPCTPGTLPVKSRTG